jgi:hypothetical protein
MTTNATGTVAPGTPAAPAPQASVSAFDKMLAFLDSEDKGPSQVEATAEGESETAEPEAESATTEETEEGGDATEETEEGAESEEQAEDEEAAKDALYTVRIDGKEEQVPLSELLAGYSRTSDYTRKTQEVATQRKELERVQSELVQERQEYSALLPKLREMLAGDESEPNWEALRRANPTQAIIEKQRWDEKQARIAVLRQEEERVARVEQERQAGELKQFVAQEREKLLKRPELAHWSDAAKRKADGESIAETLLAAGFSEEELQIVDHRAMLIAYKAALFDRAQKSTAAAKKSVERKIERSPTVKAGTPAGKPKNAADRARSRLAQTGRKEDAEAYFLHTLK